MYPFCFHCGAEVCLDLGIGPKEPAVRPQPWSTRAWNAYEVTAYLVYFFSAFGQVHRHRFPRIFEETIDRERVGGGAARGAHRTG